jgi:hypothetical protein
MNYNAKRSANKFATMNTNRNTYLSLSEAIAAATKAGSILSSQNKNRFSKANISAPYGKLNIQEYQQMVKMKRGISTVANLRQKMNQPPKNIKSLPTPGKLTANRTSFLQHTKPLNKLYNAKRNGNMIKSQVAKTLANANKNEAARRANMHKRNANLRKSRNLYQGGKLNKRIGQFNLGPYQTPVYNTRPKNMPFGISVKNRMKKFA